MTYDGNVTFNYYVDGVLVKTQVSSAARVGPANNPARGVGTRVNTSNPAAYVMASFDDFRVNDALYDDFNAPSGKIDPAKWVTHELARDPTGGHDLRMRLGAHNTSRSVSARLTQPAGYFAISARVRVSEYTSTGGYLRGRIVLATYNDGVLSGPPDSRASDIVAEVGVTDTQAFLQVVRCTSTSGTECLGTLLTDPQGIGRLPLGDVSLMSVHTLFLASNQATFVAQLDDNPPVRFDAAAAGAPLVRFTANVPVLELGARANLSSGQSGHITASFDEVRAGGVLHLN
jgi:hypothetical protein